MQQIESPPTASTAELSEVGIQLSQAVSAGLVCHRLPVPDEDDALHHTGCRLLGGRGSTRSRWRGCGCHHKVCAVAE